ncbi:hypothetical protein AAF712_011612 [Marasmius tenuissimus]|uniref:Heme haloperoxidase family profile domain-containing protein n=1 Tax=Marasmius tenuissimus TaxID=585030 RepID=A0ABR2ZJT6_9AGAR
MLSHSFFIALITVISQCTVVSSSSASMRRSPDFDPHTQRIDVGGQHKFIPPGHGDIRGPCPGLNALANHNYLPHNGVATVDEFVSATHDVFGMGLDLGTFLSVYGSLMTGDLTTFSIGGPPPIGPILGHPLGLSRSHNKYETDASTTRGDLYETGDDVHLNMTQFKSLYDKQAGKPDSEVNYDVPLLNQFRNERFHESIHHNPNFFNGAFSGLAVQAAGSLFIQRFMANRSAEHPEGILDRHTLKSFFAVSGDTPSDFVYQEGWERIPDNWYKRSVGDDYGLEPFNVDLLAAALEYPIFLSVGGNTGTVDSFTGVSLEDFTGGVLNAASLLRGDNLLCFIVQAAIQALTPDILIGLGGDVLGALERLRSPMEGRNCPALGEFNTQLLEKFPGYTRK